MNVHQNARLTPVGRERIVRLVEAGQAPQAVGQALGVCPKTVRKWVKHYRTDQRLACTRRYGYIARFMPPVGIGGREGIRR